MIDTELGRMEDKLKDLAEHGTQVVVIPVRNQKTKIETVYIPVSIDKLLEDD
jgi:formylmethanofuran dehydrogenase subunit D